MTAGQLVPPPERDLALIRAYEAERGFRYTDEQVRYGLLSIFARRCEAAGLKGYALAWADNGRVYVNMKPPFDRVALLNLAAPELRPVLQIRAVRFDAADIKAGQERIGKALAPITDGWAITHNYRTDRFEVMVPAARIGTALSLIPLDLSDYTDVEVGEIVPVGAVTSQPAKGH